MSKGESKSGGKPPKRATEQRSFRFSTHTVGLLDERAHELGETRNGLAQRLLDEGLRTDRHPLIAFREAGHGIRRPVLVGRRLSVGQVLSTLRAGDNSVADAAEYLDISEREVRAVVDYYADFAHEVDAAAAEDRELERRERERSERARRVLG